jgi:quaternary ammonium compound-resistance protein SugE
MAWFILFVAGIFEIAWAVGLKYSEGLSKFWPSVFTIVCLVISMGMLAFAVRSLPVGTAYAVWTGIGAVGTVILGMVLFNEPKDLARIFFIGMILAGIIGLKFFTK